MTWHNTSHHIASNDVSITWPDPGTDIKTSKHFTSKHKTSPPWKGRRLVHSKEMIWASRWSVTMRTFYRQILSVLYSSFPFGNFRPRLVRALLVNISRYRSAFKMNSGEYFCRLYSFYIQSHSNNLLNHCQFRRVNPIFKEIQRTLAPQGCSSKAQKDGWNLGNPGGVSYLAEIVQMLWS